MMKAEGFDADKVTDGLRDRREKVAVEIERAVAFEASERLGEGLQALPGQIQFSAPFHRGVV